MEDISSFEVKIIEKSKELLMCCFFILHEVYKMLDEVIACVGVYQLQQVGEVLKCALLPCFGLLLCRDNFFFLGLRLRHWLTGTLPWGI